MAVAGSLVVNVSADATKLEEGFDRAKKASKSFVQHAQADLKGMIKANKAAGKIEDMVSNLGPAGFAGLITGGVAGAGVGSIVSTVVAKLDEASGFSALIARDWELGGKYLLDQLGIMKDTTELLQQQAMVSEQAAEVHRKTIDELEKMRSLEKEIDELERGRDTVRLENAQNKFVVEETIRKEKLIAQLKEEKRLKEEIEAVERKAAQAQQWFNQNQPAAANIQWGLDQLAQLEALQRQIQGTRADKIQAQMQNEDQAWAAQRNVDQGGTAALRAGSGAAFSAEQKSRRLVEQQKGGPQGTVAERALKIEQDQLKKQEAAEKQREKILKAIEDNDKIKQAKF